MYLNEPLWWGLRETFLWISVYVLIFWWNNLTISEGNKHDIFHHTTLLLHICLTLGNSLKYYIIYDHSIFTQLLFQVISCVKLLIRFFEILYFSEIARQAAQIKLLRKLQKQEQARVAKEAKKQQGGWFKWKHKLEEWVLGDS